MIKNVKQQNKRTKPKQLMYPVAQSNTIIQIGDQTLNGSWRAIISGQNLIFQRRDFGVWTDQNVIG